MGYSEKSKQLALDASVAVLALLGDTPGDSEFIPLVPRMADAERLADITRRWPGRGLRSVGLLALCGSTARAVFKEPLEDPQITVLAEAFLAYLQAGFSDRVTELQKGDEVLWLERLHALEDPR